MDVAKKDDGSLLLTYDSGLWAKWMAGGALVFAEALPAVLGHATRPATADAVRALLASGRKVDAIKMLVEEEKLSLGEAKARVDALSQVHS